MLQTLKNAWRIEELRKKILFTLLILALYRLGNAIPVPYVNVDALQAYFASLQNTVLGLLNVMSGGAFSQATIFALSIQPYINASIIIQLLCIAIPITLGASIIPITSMLDVKMIFACMGKYMSETAVNQRYVALSTNVRSLINLPASLTTALAMSIVPAIAGARARKDSASMHHFAGLGLKLSMAIGMPCAAGLFVLGGPIIQMLFRSIQPDSLKIATSIMHVASLSVIFISLVQTMTGALQGMGRQHWPVWSLLAGGVLKIVSNYIFLSMPAVNILGASISNVVCYGVAGVIDTILVLRVTGLRIKLWDMFLKPLVCSLVMGITVFAAYKGLYALHPGTFVTLVAVLLGVGVYFGMAVVTRLFTPEELDSIPGGGRIKRFLRKV